MTFSKKQNMYNELSRVMVLRAVWHSFAVSIYPDYNIDSRLNFKGEL